MKKFIISLIKVIVWFLGWSIIVGFLPFPEFENPVIWRFFAELIPLVITIVMTFVFLYIEKRSIKLYFFNNVLKGFSIGIFSGLVWLLIPVVMMISLNTMILGDAQKIEMLPLWFVSVFLNVVMQELLVRGYLYQMLKQKNNAIVAGVVTTLVFTALHGGAFEVGVIPVFNVLTMSLLMTIVLEYTNSIIAPIMMHFLWNGIGALVLGGVNLASDYPKMFDTIFTGSEILSGGMCKLEGSVFVLITNVLMIVVFVVLQKVKPMK
ncbi:MAG: CPBP family intramembrane metalloprotease [Clostridia bacterium]|nr:CPBP family intramembrane metalloprotease [Clostridia bacterium]